MKKAIERIKQSSFKNIIVIGDIMLDEYIFGAVARISPEAPVPILHQQRTEWSLGGAANVALNCKHIGGNVSLFGIINNHDVSGKKLLSMLHDNNLSTTGIIESSSRLTTCKKRVMAQNHQLLRIDIEDNHMLDPYERATLMNNLLSSISHDSIIVISDYAKGMIDKEVMQTIIARAQNYNCLVLVDPKGPHFDKYQGAHYIKPNLKEFNEMIDFFDLEREHPLEQNAQIMCRLLSLKGLIITMGDKGIWFVSTDQSISIPAIEREVFDLTGAGDTVIAFLSLGLLNNLPIETCLHLANKAASVAISHLKTYAVSLDEIECNL